jgi:glycosyltransferase involved in cell wall biosynthesis
MTITIVCDVLGKENNGTTIAAMNLIRYLKSKGHTVRVLCSDQEKAGQEGYYIVPNRNFWIFNNYIAKNGVALAKPVKTTIKEAIKDSDIIHIMMPFSLGRTSAKIANEMDKPVSAGFHVMAEHFSTHIFMKDNALVNLFTYIHFSKLYRYCDAIQYPTQFVREVYEKRFGKTNGYVISNGVNERFRPLNLQSDNGKINILYIGRYSEEKSHRVLIKAVKKSAYKDRIQLIFAGDGPLKNKLIRSSRKLPVKPVFKFFSRDEMVNVINSAYIYVHAAEIETEGIGCLEAIVCGVVPLISDSRKSATKYYAIDDKSLFRYNSPKDLAKKIDWWIEHPEIKDEYSKKYLKLADNNFNLNSCMEKMENMLLKTIEEYNSKTR